MRTPVRILAWVLPLMLTACFHRSHPKPQNQTLAPPVQQPPVVEAASVPAEPPTQPGTAPTLQTLPPPEPQQQSEEKTPKHATHHRRTSPKDAVDEASNGSPAVSAVGQLSSGDPADLRGQAESTIAETERGLRELDRPLDDQERKTVAQIKEFLKQAKAALVSGDVDGANTLARKAKVLFGELRH
jgi:hypothetical protein